jgi:hypothetical protein
MSDENQNAPIGDPEPIDNSEGWTILTKFAGVAIVVCGGFAAFTVLTPRTRLAGATTSSRLNWQQTQVQVQNIAAVNSSSLTNTAQPHPPKPRE